MAFIDEKPTRRLEVPGEDSQWFEVRELSWKELQICRNEHGKKYMARLREMDPQFFKVVSELEREDEKRVEQAREENASDPASEYDPEELVGRSVVGWSYPRHFQKSLLEKLDEPTFKWLFEEIVKLHQGGDDAQRKDASEPFMTT